MGVIEGLLLACSGVLTRIVFCVSALKQYTFLSVNINDTSFQDFSLPVNHISSDALSKKYYLGKSEVANFNKYFL